MLLKNMLLKNSAYLLAVICAGCAPLPANQAEKTLPVYLEKTLSKKTTAASTQQPTKQQPTKPSAMQAMTTPAPTTSTRIENNPAQTKSPQNSSPQISTTQNPQTTLAPANTNKSFADPAIHEPNNAADASLAQLEKQLNTTTETKIINLTNLKLSSIDPKNYLSANFMDSALKQELNLPPAWISNKYRLQTRLIINKSNETQALGFTLNLIAEDYEGNTLANVRSFHEEAALSKTGLTESIQEAVSELKAEIQAAQEN